MISTPRNPDNISPEAFTAIFDALDREGSGKSAAALKHVYQPLRDSLGRKELPSFRSRRSNAPEKEGPLGWKSLSITTAPGSSSRTT
jgi:hypothetical protein